MAPVLPQGSRCCQLMESKVVGAFGEERSVGVPSFARQGRTTGVLSSHTNTNAASICCFCRCVWVLLTAISPRASRCRGYCCPSIQSFTLKYLGRPYYCYKEQVLVQRRRYTDDCNDDSCVHMCALYRDFCSIRFYVLHVRWFCELLSFNLYSNGCVFEFVGGFFCASSVNVKRLVVFVFSVKGLLQKHEGRRRTWHTSVTQPITSRKGDVGTSGVFAFLCLKHFMFFGFLFGLTLRQDCRFEIKGGGVEKHTQELKIVCSKRANVIQQLFIM